MLRHTGQARARVEAQLVADFLRIDVLRSAREVLGRKATVIDILNAAVAKLDEGELQGRPLIEASIREKLALTYFDLGYYAVAAQHQKPAYRIYVEQLGENHTTTNIALNWLTVFYYHGGKYREAEPLYKQVIEKARQHKTGFLAEYKLVWNANLGATCAGLGRYTEAEQLLRPFIEGGLPTGYGSHLGEIYREQGKYEEAGRVLHETLDAARTLDAGWGRENKEEYDAEFYNDRVCCMNELALVRLAQGRQKEAEELFEQGIDLGTIGLPGKDHPHMLRCVNGLAKELKNTLKTRGHRVTILTPPTLILPEFEAHIGHFFAEKRYFLYLQRLQWTLQHRRRDIRR